MKESELRNMLQEKNLPDSWWLTVDGKVESSPVSLGTAMTLKKAQPRSQIFVAHTSDNNPQPNWIELEHVRETMPPITKAHTPPALTEPMAQMDKDRIERYRSSLNLPDQWWVAVNGDVQKDPVTEEIAKLLKTSSPSAKILVANVQADSANPFWIDLVLPESEAPRKIAAPATPRPVRTIIKPLEPKAAETKTEGAPPAGETASPAAEPAYPVSEDILPASAGNKKPVIIGGAIAALLLIGIGIYAATRPSGDETKATTDNGKPKPAEQPPKASANFLVSPEMALSANSALVARINLPKVRAMTGGDALAKALVERFLAGPLFSEGPLGPDNLSEILVAGESLGQTWPDAPGSFCVALVPAKPLTRAELAEAAQKAGASSSWTSLDNGASTLALPAGSAQVYPLPAGKTLVLAYAVEPVTQVFVGTSEAVTQALARSAARKSETPAFATNTPLPANAACFQAGLIPVGNKGAKAAEQAATFLTVLAQSTAPLAEVSSYAVELSDTGKNVRLTLAAADEEKAKAVEKMISEELIGPAKSLARRTYLKIPGFVGSASASRAGTRVTVSSTVSPEDSPILASMATRATPADLGPATPAPKPQAKPTQPPAKPAQPSTVQSKPTPAPSQAISANAKAIIAKSSSWKYLADSNWPANWNAAEFDDSAWPMGPTPIGYGDIGVTNKPVATTVTGKPVSVIARQKFTVANPAALKRIVIRLQRDDGAVLYLNGREIHRTGMPSGRITFDTLANRQVNGPPEGEFEAVALPVSLLKSGENVIALSLHQDRATSTDLFFDLELLAE